MDGTHRTKIPTAITRDQEFFEAILQATKDCRLQLQRIAASLCAKKDADEDGDDE